MSGSYLWGDIPVGSGGVGTPSAGVKTPTTVGAPDANGNRLTQLDTSTSGGSGSGATANDIFSIIDGIWKDYQKGKPGKMVLSDEQKRQIADYLGTQEGLLPLLMQRLQSQGGHSFTLPGILDLPGIPAIGAAGTPQGGKPTTYTTPTFDVGSIFKPGGGVGGPGAGGPAPAGSGGGTTPGAGGGANDPFAGIPNMAGGNSTIPEFPAGVKTIADIASRYGKGAAEAIGGFLNGNPALGLKGAWDLYHAYRNGGADQNGKMPGQQGYIPITSNQWNSSQFGGWGATPSGKAYDPLDPSTWNTSPNPSASKGGVYDPATGLTMFPPEPGSSKVDYHQADTTATGNAFSSGVSQEGMDWSPFSRPNNRGAGRKAV